MFGKSKVVPILPAGETGAPLKIVLEAWPEEMRGRAAIVQYGKTRDVEVSSLVLRMILQALTR